MNNLLSTTLLCSLIALSAATRVTQEIYPCPHSGTTRLPHSSSCDKFVQCVNGYAVEEDCAKGLFFSQERQMCTPEWQANCVVEQSPCPTWTDPENLVFLSNGMQCDRYFMCFNGKPIEMQCASGLTFNSRTNQCSQEACRVSLGGDSPLLAFNLTCPPILPQTTHWSCSSWENQRHPDDNDCERYYHCQNGVQYGGRCPEGLLFDSRTSRCVEPRDATCGQFTTTPTTTGTSTGTTGSTGSTVSCAPTCTTPTFTPPTWEVTSETPAL